MKERICRCQAYTFPHREGSGRCWGEDPERGDDEAADRWLLGLMERGSRSEDVRLDDPRHGQAEGLNRERYKP